MKKFFILCLFSLLLVSCGQEVNEEIKFVIDSNIQLELDHYYSSQILMEYVQAYKGEEAILYTDLKVTNMEPVKLGKVKFEVSYEDRSESFYVTFVDNYSIVTIYELGGPRSIEITNGASLENLNLSSEKAEYVIESFYSDFNYLHEIDIKKPIYNDLDVYVKYSYQTKGNTSSVDPITVSTELENYIDLLMSRTSGYIPAWNQEGFKGRWNYIDGVFLNSIVNLYYETGNAKYKNFFLNYINYYINEYGAFINPADPTEGGYRTGELDSVCESKLLFDAYAMTKDDRYLTAIYTTQRLLFAQPTANSSPNFWHKTTYDNQIWLDGMYMYVPFLARYAKENQKEETFSLIKSQYEYIRQHMFDEKKKLYYHGHDTTKSVFWADKATGNSENFWLRSNGWFIVSLVDALEYFPEGSEKEYLNQLLKEAVEGLLSYQDPQTKMFFQLIDKGPTTYYIPRDYLTALKNPLSGSSSTWVDNYLESSGSSMIAYALMKSARLGYLDGSYSAIGKEIFEGIYKHSYINGELKDICITAGLGPDSNRYRDGSITYYLAERVGSNDAKGVGPFLMAYIEYAKLEETLKKYYTIQQILPTGTREISYLAGSSIESLPYPVLPEYNFIGFYYDEEYQSPVSLPLTLNSNKVIYLKYEAY